MDKFKKQKRDIFAVIDEVFIDADGRLFSAFDQSAIDDVTLQPTGVADYQAVEPAEETVQPTVYEQPVEEPVEAVAEETVEEPVEEVAEETVEEPVEEVAEETVEEPVEEVAEETVEEPVEEVAEEVTEEEPIEEVAEETVEEPVEEVAEEVTEEAVAQETFEEIEQADVAAIDADVAITASDVAAVEKQKVISKTFAQKMLEASDILQDRYDELLNYAARFKKVKARISRKFDSINQGRLQFVKLSVAGKTLKLYLNMDIDTVDPKFHCKDMRDKKTYVTVPVLLRVKSGRAIKYAKRLIDQCAEVHGLKENKKYQEIDAIARVESFQMAKEAKTDNLD